MRTPVAGRTTLVDAQRKGWYAYGWASHVFPTLVTTVFMSRYLTKVAENAVGKEGRVHVLGIPIAPGSLFVFDVSAGTVLLIVLMPVIGAVADRSGHKRDLMLAFGWFGAAACVAMVGVTREAWQLGAVLYALAFIAFSCSLVVFYSMLPDLSTHNERDHVSSVGWGISYLGGGTLLAAAFVASTVLHNDALLARLALCASGIWWAAFSIVPLRLLPKHSTVVEPVDGGSLLAAGFRQAAGTLRELRGYPVTLAFLIAFLVYNDGIQTVTTVSAQYGDKELRLSDTTLLLGILLVQFVAYVGALWLGRLAERWGAKRVILGALLGWLVAIGCGYALQARAPLQFYALATLIALVLGGSQALSRSVFSRLIPVGSEARYFGFYEISDAGTSWLGPLLFGLAYQNTGSYRTALVSLVVFFVVGFLLLARVPIRRGIAEAGNLAPARV
jgi:MFS transporter, UMF1 family